MSRPLSESIEATPKDEIPRTSESDEPSCAAGWSEAAYTMARRRDTPTKGGTLGDDSEKKVAGRGEEGR